MKRHIVWITTLLFAGLMYATTSLAAVQSPTALMQNIANSMISYLQKHKSQLRNPNVVHKIVNQALIPHISINRMAAAVVGRQYWLGATKAQRKAFVKGFTRMVISTYSSALASYDGDKVRVYPLRGGYQNRSVVFVNSMIVRLNGQRIPIGYNLVRSGDTWKVYDFSIENVSMVRSYRAQFAGVLSSSGMAGLLNRIASHNRKS